MSDRQLSDTFSTKMDDEETRRNLEKGNPKKSIRIIEQKYRRRRVDDQIDTHDKSEVDIWTGISVTGRTNERSSHWNINQKWLEHSSVINKYANGFLLISFTSIDDRHHKHSYEPQNGFEFPTLLCYGHEIFSLKT